MLCGHNVNNFGSRFSPVIENCHLYVSGFAVTPAERWCVCATGPDGEQV